MAKVIRIIVSARAYSALNRGKPPPRHMAAEGGYPLWLASYDVERLNPARGPGEGYSEVILRLAEQETPFFNHLRICRSLGRS